MTEQERKSKKNKTVFKDFAEYWHFVRFLTEDQRSSLINSLSKQEQRSLQESYKKGGWEDLFMRNQCDRIIDDIKNHFHIDLLEIRSKLKSGKHMLIQKSFWEYVTNCFDRIPWHHIEYIFEGFVAIEHDPEYLKLIPKKD